jgi:hypothetical protein
MNEMEFLRAPKGKKYIYVLFIDSVAMYVGQTVQLCTRVKWHISDKKSFNMVSYYEVDECEANNAEAITIVKYKPVLNGSMPKNTAYKSIDKLLKEIGKEITTNNKEYNVEWSLDKSGLADYTVSYIDAEKSESVKREILEIFKKNGRN